MNDTPRKVLSSASQLDGVKLSRKQVYVPEWDLWVWVYELTGEELDGWRQGMLRPNRRDRNNMELDPRKLRGQTARLVVLAVRDEDGQRIFADMDAPMLLRKGAGAVERLATVARELSRLVNDEDEFEMEGNDSGPTPGVSSNSDSPGTSAVLSLS